LNKGVYLPRNIPITETKVLWGKSGNRCAMCKNGLTIQIDDSSELPLGEAAHIEGYGVGSPRYNPSMSEQERNSYSNLILLCPTCHSIIDKDISEYTTTKIKTIKNEHEKWIESLIKDKLPNITYKELEVILDYLVNNPANEQKNVEITRPEDKIIKNGLSSDVSRYITQGMLQVKLVNKFIVSYPDPNYSEKLRSIFVQKYKDLREDGLSGDSLFYSLFDFAAKYSIDFKLRAAGLAVLTYFFEICEVFER